MKPSDIRRKLAAIERHQRAVKLLVTEVQDACGIASVVFMCENPAMPQFTARDAAGNPVILCAEREYLDVQTDDARTVKVAGTVTAETIDGDKVRHVTGDQFEVLAASGEHVVTCPDLVAWAN